MRTQNLSLPQDVLIPHFGQKVPIVGVEIGVSGGTGSASMLMHLPNLKLYCVDPWKHIDLAPYEAGLSQEIHDQGYQEALNKMSPYMNRVIIVRKTSDDALVDIPDGLDFVHIDGHHEYAQVIKDIKNYLPKIKKGGLLSGHDYIQVPDVTRAVQEVFAKEQINTGEDFIWWVYV